MPDHGEGRNGRRDARRIERTDVVGAVRERPKGVSGMKRRESVVLVLGAAALVLGAWSGVLPLGLTETIAAVTGAITVWLTVKQDIWNWPIGIASSAFFFALFLGERLFADMILQFIYIVLGFLGWY